MKNNLLEEIWKTRDQMGAECGYDLKRIGTLVRREEIKSGKRIVRLGSVQKIVKAVGK
jgi:hypothetical protein